MGFTFNPALTNPVSRVRQNIGDTTDLGHQVDDATINYYLNSGGFSELKTAARLCWDLAAKFAGMADVTVDDQLQRFSQISKRYAELAVQLDAKADGAGPANTSGDATSSIIVMGGDYTNAEWLFGLCPPR